MDNRITEERVFVIASHDLNHIVTEFFGRDWSFIEDEEAKNDNVYRFTLDAEHMSEHDWDYLHRWVRGEKGKYLTYYILTAMAMVGHIPMGTYIVEVCW